VAGTEVLAAVGMSERMAEEQAALRRVATLVAGAGMPEALPPIRTRVKHCPRPRAILM
jgi:hypothetical protein